MSFLDAFKSKAQRRDALFREARRRLAIVKEADPSAVEQLEPQICYLAAVNSGRERGERLSQMTIGVIAARWLDPCPKELEILFDVARQADLMTEEYEQKTSNAQTH